MRRCTRWPVVCLLGLTGFTGCDAGRMFAEEDERPEDRLPEDRLPDIEGEWMGGYTDPGSMKSVTLSLMLAYGDAGLVGQGRLERRLGTDVSVSGTFHYPDVMMVLQADEPTDRYLLPGTIHESGRFIEGWFRGDGVNVAFRLRRID